MTTTPAPRGPWDRPNSAPVDLDRLTAKLRLHMRLARMLVLFSQGLIFLGAVFIVLSDLGMALPLLILGAFSWAVTRRWTMWLERKAQQLLAQRRAEAGL